MSLQLTLLIRCIICSTKEGGEAYRTKGKINTIMTKYDYYMKKTNRQNNGMSD